MTPKITHSPLNKHLRTWNGMEAGYFEVLIPSKPANATIWVSPTSATRYNTFSRSSASAIGIANCQVWARSLLVQINFNTANLNGQLSLSYLLRICALVFLDAICLRRLPVARGVFWFIIPSSRHSFSIGLTFPWHHALEF